MKFTQLLLVLAMCSAAFAQAVSTTTTVVATPTNKPNIYFQEAPLYTVTVTAATGTAAPAGLVAVIVGGVARGNCTLDTSTTTIATCQFTDTKTSGSPNLPLGSNTATASFTPSDANAFSASQGTQNFIVYALPVLSLTYGGAANDVNVPAGVVTTLVVAIDITNSGTTDAPAGIVTLSQTSNVTGFNTLQCTVSTTSPYQCSFNIPSADLTLNQNYTLLAAFAPSTGSKYGPDGSSSITLRVVSAVTTSTTSTSGTTTTTTTSATGTTTTTSGGAPNGYSSVTVAAVFLGSCAVNFTSSVQTGLATLLGGFAAQGVNFTQVGACVDNTTAGTFTVNLQATATGTTPIPANFLTIAGSALNTGLANIGLNLAGNVTIISFVPAPAASTTSTSTSSTTSGKTTTTTNQASSTSSTTNQVATGVSTNQGTTQSTNGNTSAASSVVVGATALLIFAALL